MFLFLAKYNTRSDFGEGRRKQFEVWSVILSPVIIQYHLAISLCFVFAALWFSSGARKVVVCVPSIIDRLDSSDDGSLIDDIPNLIWLWVIRAVDLMGERQR